MTREKSNYHVVFDFLQLYVDVLEHKSSGARRLLAPPRNYVEVEQTFGNNDNKSLSVWGKTPKRFLWNTAKHDGQKR
jgi:hypothetical protein